MNRSFEYDIEEFNKLYRLPVNYHPTLSIGEPVNQRLLNFKKTLIDEINEMDDVVDAYFFHSDIETLVQLSDLLGDIIIYCASEARKFGIPLTKVLGIITESNMSKLGEDGMPIYNEDGKVMKGPDYWKPEPVIKQLLEEDIKEYAKGNLI